jgi:hypothetical protein
MDPQQMKILLAKSLDSLSERIVQQYVRDVEQDEQLRQGTALKTLEASLLMLKTARLQGEATIHRVLGG